jgi:FliG C-terminal domain
LEETFASLSKRQSMMLLTAVTYKGAESVSAFDHLPDEEGELLKHRAEKLLQIPKDKRIPLLVQEIKRLVTARRRQLGSVDAAKLAQTLSKERPAMVEVVLRALPSNLAETVRQQLPNGHQKLALRREVRPDVLSIIRWKLEESLNKSVPQVGAFKFSDVLTLQARDLLAVCDRMGARSLATALAGLPEAEREQFMSRLPPDQRQLAVRATEAGKTRKLTPEDSATVLKMFGADKTPSPGLRSAGAQRLARAAVAQGPDFAQRLVDRHQNELGRLLARWLKEEKGRAVRGDGGRADIVEQLERLSQRGVIDRPMRLPPPPGKKSVAEMPKVGAENPPPSEYGAKLLPPLPKRSESQARLPQVAPDRRGAEPRHPPPLLLPPPGVARRDPVAERVARQAGAATGRAKERASGQRRRPAVDPRQPAASVPPLPVRADPRRGGAGASGVSTGSRAAVLKADRGGDRPKLPPPPGAPRVSPGLQEFPKRRPPPKESQSAGRSTRSGLRSPVVKGGSRGPGGGTR